MKKGILCLFIVALLVAAGAYELQTSYLQSRYISRYASELTFTVERGPSDKVIFPVHGPYNERHGYTKLPIFIDRLHNRSFEIQRQARFSDTMYDYVGYGVNPPYAEKQQSGLSILDDSDMLLYNFREPGRIYQRFNEIPPLLVNTLLFIENRELLDDKYPMHNPAVEWDRLAEVVVAHGVNFVKPGQDTAGASTLATQIEKYRYSPDGLTTDIREKLRQMVSATVRSYTDGADTSAARRRIVRDYINSTPLSGRSGFGEILGMGEGLWAWYGVDFEVANQILSQAPTAENRAEQARIYKYALSLLLSQRRPSHYLLSGREELARLTDSYLRVMANAAVIEPQLRDAALAQPLIFRSGKPEQTIPDFTTLKAVNNVRTKLLKLLGIKSLYELDRYDLTVRTTVASQVQDDVAAVLQQLNQPEYAASMGLLGKRLLSEDQLDDVRFSVLLYESTAEGNKLRVQTDNLDMPFDLNDDSKLDLGSTAKLRTLVTYLSIVETLYHRHQDQDRGERVNPTNAASDPLRQWVATYVMDNPESTLQNALDAAMNRHYSASPFEWFFTAGGRHQFHNFEKADNYRIMSVAEALNRSVNLVFIRMMRDVSRFYINEIPGIHELLDNNDNPVRREYLERFADQEGQEFLLRFYNAYRGKSGQQLIDHLATRTRPTPYRLAMAFRSVQPEGDIDAMTKFMSRRLGEDLPAHNEIQTLYDKYGKDQFDSNDRAYLSGVNPLELWMVNYLLDTPDAKFDELVTNSVDERQTAYKWLFKTKSWNKQQKRIRILVEEDAFKAIHTQWRQMGYPFPTLVPSYATALGVSADRPTALTELMGILVNDGLKLPSQEIESLHFAEATPYETEMKSVPRVGEQVLSQAISQTVRNALAGIVESGTARRLNEVYKDHDGKPLVVGGKTGTGDHRSKQFGRGGYVISEKVVNRNAIFTFFIGDRFFGTILASVGGPKAKNFDFTSGLAVQLLKSLEPALSPLINEPNHELAQQDSELVVQHAY